MTTTEYNEAKETYIKELVSSNSRIKLDEIAKALGLEPKNYANKREIALAIMMAANHQDSLYKSYVDVTDAEEEKEEMGVQLSSVKSIRKAINDKADNFMKFYKGEFLANITAFHDATQMFRDDIKEQMKENNDWVNNEFGQSVKEYQQSIETFRRCILEQSKENQKYIKQFYG
jgi:hypothetical protein